MAGKRITDKERLDWLSRRTIVEQLWDYGDEQVTRLATFDIRGGWGSLSLRKAIDMRILADGKSAIRRERGAK